MNLEEMRDSIDQIDSQIVDLLNERYRIVQKVGEWKKERKLPIFVPERENALLEKLSALNTGPMQEATLRSIYREIIAGSYLLEQTTKE